MPPLNHHNPMKMVRHDDELVQLYSLVVPGDGLPLQADLLSHFG